MITVVIDADAFLWEFGGATDNEFKPLRFPFVQSRIQGRIDQIVQATGADDYKLFLTADNKSNFRFNTATILPYKGNRSIERPHHYDRIRNFLVSHRGAVEVHNMEADDALSIVCWEAYKKSLQETAMTEGASIMAPEVILASRDKDLNMVPGWHYTWGCGNQKEKPVWFQSELGGLKCFYKQLLTGDSTDNILGLYGVGKKSKLLLNIDECTDEVSMFQEVYRQYKLRFGSYAMQFLLENGRLLWMLEREDQVWCPPSQAILEEMVM